MGYVQLAVAAITLTIKLIDMWNDRNTRRKKKKKEAINVVMEGITRRDSARVSAGFDALNRLR